MITITGLEIDVGYNVNNNTGIAVLAVDLIVKTVVKINDLLSNRISRVTTNGT